MNTNLQYLTTLTFFRSGEVISTQTTFIESDSLLDLVSMLEPFELACTNTMDSQGNFVEYFYKF